MGAGGSQQFTNSTAYLQQVLDAVKNNGGGGVSSATSSAPGSDTNSIQGDVAADKATKDAELHAHHIPRVKKRKAAGSKDQTNDKKGSAKEGSVPKKAGKKRGKSTSNSSSDATKSSDTSSEASFSSMSTLATVKDQFEVSQDSSKKDEVSDISTSGSSDVKSKKNPNDSGASSTSENDTSSSSRKRQLPTNAIQDHGADGLAKTNGSIKSPEGPSNKKVRVIDPADKTTLKKQNSDSDSGDLSSASDWGSNEDGAGGDLSSLADNKAGTLGILKARRMYTSEVSSVSASGSDSGSATGSDNGGGSGPGSDIGDKVETDSHTSIASLLEAARAAEKKD